MICLATQSDQLLQPQERQVLQSINRLLWKHNLLNVVLPLVVGMIGGFVLMVVMLTLAQTPQGAEQTATDSSVVPAILKAVFTLLSLFLVSTGLCWLFCKYVLLAIPRRAVNQRLDNLSRDPVARASVRKVNDAVATLKKLHGETQGLYAIVHADTSGRPPHLDELAVKLFVDQPPARRP